MCHFRLHWKKIRSYWKNKGDSGMIQTIPEGSTLKQMKNGDVLITFPGAMISTLCVQADQHVRRAIVPEPVEESLAEAARQYVMQHLTKEQSNPM
jgi:beta-galactosidase beta subunit